MAVGELVVSIIGDMKELSKTFSQVQKEIGEVGKTFTSLGSSLSSTGSAMTTGITAPIVATGLAIGGVTKEAMGFQKEMTQVFTLMPNVSRSTMNSMENDIKSFSKEMGVTTTRVIPALYDAIGSGVPEDNVFNFLEVAHKGAVANVTDIGVAVDGLTSVLNAYGYENLSAAEASDILFTGINVGKMSYEELGKSLSSVVPTAASIGVKFGDVTAALAAMTAQGTPTAEATTQLNRLLSELSKNGTVVSDSFKELTGKSFYKFIQDGGTLQGAIKILDEGFVSLDPNIKKIQEQMYQLADPTSNLGMEFEGVAGKSFKEFRKEGGTVEQALEMLGVTSESSIERVSELFGSIEAGNAILSLTGQGATIFNDALKEMENSAGATDRAYAMMSETASGSIDRIIARLQVASIEMGEKFIPIVEDTIVPLITDAFIPALEVAVDVIGVVADAFNKLPQPVKVVILAVIAFIAALGPVLVAIGAVVSSIGTLAAAFGTGGALAGAISFISATILPALSAAFGIIVYTVIPIVIEAIALLATPFGLVAAALAVFVLAWKNNWFDIQGKAKTVWDWLKAQAQALGVGLQAAYNAIISSGATLKAQFSVAWEAVKAALSSAGSALQSIASGIYSKLQGVYNQIVAAVNSLRASWSSAWSAVQSATSAASSGLQSIISGLYSRAQALFNQIKSAASSFYTALNSIWESIKSVTRSFSSSLQSIISSLYSSLQNLFNQIKAAINALYTAIKMAWDNIVSAVKSAGSQLISAIAGLPGAIKGYASAFANAGKAILDALYNAIVDGFNKTIKKAKDMLSELRGYLPSSPAETGPFKKLPDWSSAISTPLKKSVNEASVTAKTAGSSIMNSVATGVKNAASKVNNSISSTFKKVRKYLPFSPAEFGPFSEIPDWDSVFVAPMLESIKKTGKLAVPLEAALNRVKSPVDSFSSGLGNISSISNTIHNAGDTITIGPNTLASGVDIRMLIEELNKYTANKRRARGLYK